MKKQQGPKQLAEALLVGLGLALGRVSLGHAEGNNRELLTPSLWFSEPQKLLVNLQGYFI